MRPLPIALGALLALLLALPAAGQVSTSLLTIDAVAVETSPVAPGNSTAVAVTFTRTCPNAATVYPEQIADVRLVPRAGWSVAGPSQVVFPQQVCAQAMATRLLVSFVASAPREAPHGETFPFLAAGRLQAANQATPASNEASFPFTIATTAAPPLEPAAEIVRESPSAGPGLLVLGLAAAVLLARRR